MTKLVLIHGINNEKNSSENIRKTWIDSLRAAVGKNSNWADAILKNTVAPFYGEKLAELSKQKKRRGVAAGIGDEDEDFLDIADRAIDALDGGKVSADIIAEWDDEGNPVSAGKGPHKIWVKAASRMIERLSPFHGRFALRALKQAHVYINRPSIAKEVDDIVRRDLMSDEPMIIVSHSLGTIVAYKLLREFSEQGKPRNCPLFLTLGSPLSLDVVRETFDKPRNRPADVARWVNGADPEDFVALHNELTIDNFGPGAINISDIDNGHEDPHSITDYLSNAEIAAEISKHFP